MISVVNSVDPFCGCVGEPVKDVLPVDTSDLVSYLVLQTKFITAKYFKAHKSLKISLCVAGSRTFVHGECM